jgi:hypothetical protein
VEILLRNAAAACACMNKWDFPQFNEITHTMHAHNSAAK